MAVVKIPFDRQPDEQAAIARAANVKLPEDFYALPAAKRATAFTVSGLAKLDQVQAVADALATMQATGGTFHDFKKWAAGQDWSLPKHRMETIYRNAVQTSYMAGHWRAFSEQAETFPHLMYDAINDSRTRPSHLALDGVIKPVGDPFWKTHSAPIGHRCRCTLRALLPSEARERGGVTQNPPIEGQPDKGWGSDPREWDDVLKRLGEEKVVKAPEAVRRSWEAGHPPDGSGIPSSVDNPKRAPWNGNETVDIVAPPATVKAHPDYSAAKNGDPAAAARLVMALMDNEWIIANAAAISASTPVLLGVHAAEGISVNMISQAMDQWLSLNLGLPVDRRIVQTNKVGHTNSAGWHRLASQALFDGEVTRGANYWLLDDFIGQGGTLANLRGHIISNGGAVVGYTALTGRSDSAILGLTDETLTALRDKHGQIEEWWREQFGFDFEALTESEAKYLLRAEDADTIRNRIVEAK